MTNLLFSFDGRANRARFWPVALGILVVKAIIVFAIFGGAQMSGDPQQMLAAIGPLAGVVIFVFFVVALWTSLAVAVKRYHDRNRSRWWILIIPCL